jgi:hypothetical protein
MHTKLRPCNSELTTSLASSRLPSTDSRIDVLPILSLRFALLKEDLVLGLQQLLLAFILARVDRLSRLAETVHDVP